MWINKSLLLLLLAALATATSSIASATTGNVTYNVFTSDRCQPDGGRSISTLMEPQAQEIGYCQNHGIGKSAYNSIEVLGCSDNCLLCFKQVASSESDTNCDMSRAGGWNVKMSCFNKCLVDCNGRNCGDTATTSRTRLMLTGSGTICASPVSEEEFSCETTSMILDDEGDVIDLLVTNGVRSTQMFNCLLLIVLQ